MVKSITAAWSIQCPSTPMWPKVALVLKFPYHTLRSITRNFWQSDLIWSTRQVVTHIDHWLRGLNRSSGIAKAHLWFDGVECGWEEMCRDGRPFISDIGRRVWSLTFRRVLFFVFSTFFLADTRPDVSRNSLPPLILSDARSDRRPSTPRYGGRVSKLWVLPPVLFSRRPSSNVRDNAWRNLSPSESQKDTSSFLNLQNWWIFDGNGDGWRG